MNLLPFQRPEISIPPGMDGLLAHTDVCEIDAVIQQSPAPAPQVDPSITAASLVVIVPKPYTTPGRVEILLGINGSFSRTGILSPSGNLGAIDILKPDGTVLQFNGTDNEFSGLQLQAGVRLFARGKTASTALNDFTLTLDLAAGPTPIGSPATISLTAVELTLDICVPRTSSGIDPPALPQPTSSQSPATATDKWFGGRLVNEQDNTMSQERAMLIVRQPRPAAFNGQLQLRGVAVNGTNVGAASNRAQLFTIEAPQLLHVPLNNPHQFGGVPANGVRFFVQGNRASASLRDMGFQLGLAGGEPDGDRVAVTVGVAPVIVLSSKVVVVKKTYTTAARKTITLRTSSTFGGTGTLTRSGNTGAIKLFRANGSELTFGTDPVFVDTDLNAGVQLSAEGIAGSGAVNDFQLTLTLTPQAAGVPAGNSVTARMTSINLTIDIFKTRSAAGVEPAAFPQPPAATPAAGTGVDKWFGGRFIHQQDPGNHHGRALVIIRPVATPGFTGQLTLRQVAVAADNPTGLDTRLQLFDNERPTGGETAKANPHVFAANTIPAAGLRLFAEGRNLSVALRDTGFQLGLDGIELDGDRVRATVMRFSNLQASIPSTPAHTARLGNSPVARHTLTRGAGALVASDFDTDFTANVPLVLIEGSVQAADPINMSVTTTPAGVPVSWSALRHTGPGSDHTDIANLSGNPTINPTTGALLTNGVGSFQVRPFVDVNGSNAFEPSIDFEPFMIMNLVLVRVTLNRDNSLSPGTNFARAPDPTAAPGTIRVPQGPFNIGAPANDDIHMNALADLVGGGDDGLRGVDRVFAGWVNNESANEDIVGTFRDTTVAPPVNHLTSSVFASNGAASATGAGPTFLPGDPAPALVAPPLLDSGRNPAGVGGDTACLRSSRIRTRTPLRTPATPAAVGQRILVEAIDSPSDGAPRLHPGFAAAQLIRFRFGLDFNAFLCFWSNITAAAGATGDPADRLYSVLLEVDWRMRGEWTVNPATGAIAVVTAPTVNSATRVTTSPAVAAVTRITEVRAPTGLNLLAVDARA